MAVPLGCRADARTTLRRPPFLAGIGNPTENQRVGAQVNAAPDRKVMVPCPTGGASAPERLPSAGPCPGRSDNVTGRLWTTIRDPYAGMCYPLFYL